MIHKTLKKIFLNDAFFAFFVCLGVTCYMIMTFFCFVPKLEHLNNLYGILCIIQAIIMLASYIAYVKEKKKAMKILVGALLITFLLSSLQYFLLLDGSTMDFVFQIIYSVLSLSLCVNHFIICNNKHSTPILVTINQIICALMVLVPGLIWNTHAIVHSKDYLHAIMYLDELIGFVSLIILVVCFESRADNYKVLKEKQEKLKKGNLWDGNKKKPM